MSVMLQYKMAFHASNKPNLLSCSLIINLHKKFPCRLFVYKTSLYLLCFKADFISSF